MKIVLVLLVALFLATAAGAGAPVVLDLPEATMMPMGPALPPPLLNLLPFGDSLSDSGNVFLFTQGAEPDPLHYWQGRWSNNQVWTEQLAGYMGMKNTVLLAQVMGGAPVPAPPLLFLNSAFGGAQTGQGFMNFLLQIGVWTDAQMPIPDNSLVTVWIGANDFLSADLSSQEQVAAVIGTAVTNIITGLTELCDNLGAQNVAILNLPDLGATPRMNGTPEGRAMGRALSENFNGALAQALAGFIAQHPLVKLYQIDIFTYFDDLLENPAKYGFTNTTQSALAQGKTFDTAAGFIFWDDIHPTTQAHQRLALEVYGQIFIGSLNPNMQYIKTMFCQAPVLGVTPVNGNLDGTGFSDPMQTNANGRPENMMFGLMTVNMSCNAGATVEWTISLPWALPQGYSWYKYMNGSWIDFAAVWEASGGLQGALISQDRRTVTVRVMDNGAYDMNNMLGQVLDPTGGGVPAQTPGNNGHSSSSSCFLKTLFR
ncbi:MAG: SGNH/GDSL hydrolase family protein [Thermodesulfobacteriota bacterium]